MERFQHYIDGRFEDGTRHFESIDPATGKPWAIMPEAGEEDVNRAVAAAKRSFNSTEWSSLTATQRGKLLYKLADLLQEKSGDIAKYETRDTGKIIRETSTQISYIADYYRYFAGLADKVEGGHLPIDKADMEVWTRREPIGVVAAIVPWNSQLFLSALKIAPALAAGCTMVLKASEEGPAPMLKFAELIDEAGFPAGVMNIITGFGAECGKVLTAHKDINHVVFTGGPETAKHVVRNTAENLASTTLELGGKSPFIVFEDADIESAVNAQISGIFAATGQSCVAGSRLIIANKVKDEFLAKLKEKTSKIKIGDPQDMATEVGPLCTLNQRNRINEIVSQSIEQGAELLVGGKDCDRDGFYYLPTILDCSNVKDASSVTNELFGPVLSVVGFDTEEEAVEIANSTIYGLAAGIFTQNLSRGHRMIKAIRSGIVWVNTYRAVSPIAPIGGFGFSGHGREGGVEALHDFTTLKTVWLRTSDDPIPDPFVMR